MMTLIRKYSIPLILMIGTIIMYFSINKYLNPVQSNQPIIPSPQIMTPNLADSRIGEFRDKYGIELVNQNCTAPCIGNEPKKRPTLQEFIERVGTPEKVRAFVDGAAGRFHVTLTYASRGFEVFAYRPINGNFTDMTPDMIVFRVDLWNSRTLSDLKRELWEVENLNIPLEQVPDWKGFGPVRRFGE